MKVVAAVASIILALSGCKTTKPDPTPKPDVSTATVGNNLNKIGTSITSAQDNVKGVRGNLSEIDAKAVRIQEYIRNW